MSNTSVRYLTMLRMVPRFPKSITTTELTQRLEEQDFSVTMRGALNSTGSGKTECGFSVVGG